MELGDGRYLISLARRTIDNYFRTHSVAPPTDAPKHLLEKRGVFVTLESYPGNDLRGCIGYPIPIKPLAQATADCALSAAFGDPRFPPLSQRELSNLVIEVSVLTLPQRIKAKNPRDYPNAIEVGKDGLIVSYGMYSGLLLPQVAPEQCWNEEEFLSHTCNKAGLPFDFWLSGKATIEKFQAEIFSETSPGGDVKRKEESLKSK